MIRTSTAAAAAAIATLFTFAAMPSAHAESTAVQVADLDLSTDDGQAKLDSRIDRAVRNVCSEAITGSRIATIDKDCASRARASIEKQVASRRATSRNGG